MVCCWPRHNYSSLTLYSVKKGPRLNKWKMSNDTIMIGRCQSEAFLTLLQDETVLWAVHCGTAWLQCCLMVGINTSGSFFSTLPLMLWGWLAMWIALQKKLKTEPRPKADNSNMLVPFYLHYGMAFSRHIFFKIHKFLAEICVSRVSSVNVSFANIYNTLCFGTK